MHSIGKRRPEGQIESLVEYLTDIGEFGASHSGRETLNKWGREEVGRQNGGRLVAF